VSVSSSTGKVSWKRTELNLWIKTLIRWNKNYTSSGSPVRSEILLPRSTRNETNETLSGPCVSTTTGWNSSVAHSSVYFRHFLSAACSATAPAAWLIADKYEWATVVQTVTSQASGLPPRQGMRVQPSVRAFSLLVSQTSWLLLYRNARCAEGAADTLV